MATFWKLLRLALPLNFTTADDEPHYVIKFGVKSGKTATEKTRTQKSATKALITLRNVHLYISLVSKP